MRKSVFTITLLFTIVFCFGQQHSEYVPKNDKNKVLQFELPNLMTCFIVGKMKNFQLLERVQHQEFLDFFTKNAYGKVPGKLEISSNEMPQVNQQIINTEAYHIRTIGNTVATCNWSQYIKWADKHFYNKEKFEPQTHVSIEGNKFYINGKPTFEGRIWQGISVEGLLPNSRMVQGVFDDLNPVTADKWKYPDTGKWDTERNTREFIEAMPQWRKHGLLAFTINFQGGSPMGYGNKNWKNPGYNPDGTLIPGYANRMERIVEKADELGMVVILGIFYFGQDQHLQDENAVFETVDNVVDWIQANGYTNVIIEVANESNSKDYDHDIITKDRIHELIIRIHEKAPELLVSTSFGGGSIPPDKVVKVSDYVLIHGNGVHEPARITQMVETVRSLSSFRPMPIVFNEDDHFDFDKPVNNFVNATKAYASWGYFDFRRKNEGFNEGYQSVPVNWGISSDRKRDFFNKVKEIFIN